MSKKQELLKDIADMKDAIKTAKDAKNQTAVDDLQPTLEEFEKELKELEEKESKGKKEPKAKTSPKKKDAKAKKEPKAPKEEEKTKEVKGTRLFGKGRKFDLKIGEKVVLEDKTVITLISETECSLLYKGESKRVVAFEYKDGAWHIDCCERGHKRYPEFKKSEIEEAVDYVLELLECKDHTEHKTKQRKAAKKKHLTPATPSAKVEGSIEIAANKIEKVAESMLKKGKFFSIPQLRNFAKDLEDVVLPLASTIGTAKDKKAFVSAIKSIAVKVEKQKIAPKKMADGGVIGNDAYNEEVFEHYIMSALWSSNDDDDTSLDSNYSLEDIEKESIDKLRALVNKFILEAKDAIEASELTPDQVGHSLWLTQNHHGAGFFDYSLDSEIEGRLTKSAHALGEVDLYIGDDEKIHASGGKFAKGGKVLKWQGVDVNLEISLEEYNFVAKEEKKGEYLVIYKTGENEYFQSYVSEKELDRIVKGDGFASEEDVDSFLSTVGSSKEEWLQLGFETKLSDLLNYWGHQNIIETSYNPENKEWAFKKVGIDSDEFADGGSVKDYATVRESVIEFIIKQEDMSREEAEEIVDSESEWLKEKVEKFNISNTEKLADHILKYAKVAYAKGGKVANSKKDFVEYLNGLGVPEADKKSENGRIPDNAKYGAWLRKNDPIAFEVGYREWVAESFAKGGKLKEIAFPNSNLYLKGAGLDTNGNWTVKVGFPNDKGFSIQTNGVLRNTQELSHKDMSELTEKEIDLMEKEITEYVSEFGSKKQKSKLKTYNK